MLLDPLGSGIYMLCGLAAARGGYREQRISNPGEFPCVVLVTLRGNYVNVFQQYGNEEGLWSARVFVDWLLSQAPCRIEDAFFEDWSERVALGGVAVLYPPQMQHDSRTGR
ncbi:MAG: hypothetical protein R3B07_35545 [Polyangiaceae bacterium]